MKIRIKRIDGTIELPKYHTLESAAFDLAASEDAVVAAKEIKLLKTGLIIETPPGYFLMISPRSSVPRKKGLSIPQSIGIVDPDYSGPDDEIMLQVYNFTDKPVRVSRGERIAQGIFIKADRVEWEEVKETRKKSRGGFGSTG